MTLLKVTLSLIVTISMCWWIFFHKTI